MKEINSKKRLAMALSGLKGFEKAKVRVEQYMTDSEIASEIVWYGLYKGDIDEKVIADYGAGTGILGIGALLMGARKVYFVESDSLALETAKENLGKVQSEHTIGGEAVFLCQDVKKFDKKADVVLQNPPFGVKEKHADKEFLEKAFETADVVYSFHKIESKTFLNRFSKDKNFEITDYFEFDFPLKATMEFHRKKIEKIKVGCWRFERRK